VSMQYNYKRNLDITVLIERMPHHALHAE